MKHARPDYNRIQDPAGLIPDDEPVFLLRAQDVIAANIVGLYAGNLESMGGDSGMVELVRRHAEAMRAWPTHKMPDLPSAHGADKAQAAALAKALIGLLSEWDKFTRYGSPMAKAANEKVERARAAITAYEARKMSEDNAEIFAQHGRIAREKGALPMVEAMAANICRNVAEIPDRTSPIDDPGMMLVLHDELHAIVIDELTAALCVQPAPCAETVGAITQALNAAYIEYSAMSWSGFNLFGDRRSVDKLKQLVHAEGTIAALRDEIIRLRASVQPAPVQGGWKTIDSAPKDGTKIEVKYISDDPRPVRWGTSDHGTWWHLTDVHRSEVIKFDPTHWRPYPNPPTMEGGG